jgi:hypothetical protein
MTTDAVISAVEALAFADCVGAVGVLRVCAGRMRHLAYMDIRQLNAVCDLCPGCSGVEDAMLPFAPRDRKHSGYGREDKQTTLHNAPPAFVSGNCGTW